MSNCLRIRLRPTGPWRIAPDSGERHRAAAVLHSDALFSAVCAAMRQLNMLHEWLAVTVQHPGGAQVRFSSMFPWQGSQFFLPAPRGVWPPPPSSKLYARGAKFLPQAAASALFHHGAVQEDRWFVDGGSECLLPSGARGSGHGPFRYALRTGAAVDRLSCSATEVHRTACVEFAANAGLWFLVEFAGDEILDEWKPRVLGALRLLADSGFGGRRSYGWGRAEIVDAVPGALADLVLGPPPAPVVEQTLPPAAPEQEPSEVEPVVVEAPQAQPVEAEALAADIESAAAPAFELGQAAPEEPPPLQAEEPPPSQPDFQQFPSAWWLLSLFTPGPGDAIDWQRGAYSLLERSGRVESPQGWGLPKKSQRMVAEGSLLFSETPPAGAASDVAPDGFAHPVYRAGFAVVVPVPFRGAQP